MGTERKQEFEFNTSMIVGESRYEKALANAGKWGRTDLHSVGESFIDEYLGGGYGRPDKYEIITIFGDTGCVSGDAIIVFKSQYIEKPHKIKLETLYKRFNNIPYRGWHGSHSDEVIRVRANSDGNLPEWVEVEDVVDKGVREVLEITAGGKSLIATPDHEFLTDDGWKELRLVKAGDKVLMSTNVSKNKGGKKRVDDHIVYTKFHPKNYTVLVEGKYKYHRGLEHRLRYEAKVNKLSYEEYIKVLNNYDGRELWAIPDGMEIHHKDGDHSNNDINNLEMISKSDHAKLGIETSISNLDYSNDFVEVESVEPAGKTKVYDISCKKIHNFMANGFCVHNCNKSTFLSQMVISPACNGKKVSYMALEDEVDDVILRIEKQLPGEGLVHNKLVKQCLNNIHFLPENDGYTLGNMATLVENMFDYYDIVVIDPIQFVFEASVTESRETEFNRQRLFMRQMNNVLKRKNKTLIMVSHTNKGGNQKERADAGMFKIIGSSAIAQVSTKVLEIGRDKDGIRMLRMHKSRFTSYRAAPIEIKLTPDMRIICPYNDEEKRMSRATWDAGSSSK